MSDRLAPNPLAWELAQHSMTGLRAEGVDDVAAVRAIYTTTTGVRLTGDGETKREAQMILARAIDQWSEGQANEYTERAQAARDYAENFTRRLGGGE